MSEEIKKSNLCPEEDRSQAENQSEKEDNRLPYESPKLYKHGKFNDITSAIPVPGSFDSAFGPVFDVSYEKNL